MNVAVIECGHWHAGMYIKALAGMQDVTITAISDRDLKKAQGHATPLGAKAYASHTELLENEKPDFAFAFGRHCDMTGIARDLVEAGVGFAMEKPMGVDWRKLLEVADLAEKRKVFVAVPLVTRRDLPIIHLANLRGVRKLGDVRHFYFRLFAGPPSRYIDMGVPWMLKKSEAGGGVILNFGPHVIDIFLHLVQEPVRRVAAAMDNQVYKTEIEDFASVLMTTASGAVGIVEVAYLLPEGYERFFSINSTTLSYTSLNWQNRAILMRDGSKVEIGKGPSFGYEGFTHDTLAAFREGRRPIAGIRDMCRVLQIINAAQESAQSGKPVDIENPVE